jgi:hypothetical protein
MRLLGRNAVAQKNPNTSSNELKRTTDIEYEKAYSFL